MGLSLDMFRPIAMRVMTIVLVLLLTAGARVGLGFRAWTGITVATAPVGQNPNQSEEEERHESHGKAASHRRQAVGVPGLARTRIVLPAFSGHAPSRVVTVQCTSPDHEADLRNGLGAPLRC